MALTREERQVIETLIKKVRALETTVSALEDRVAELQNAVNIIDAESNILDWTSDQVEEWLKPFILKYMTRVGSKLTKHNHTNDEQGGDCFSKLGANLID